MLPAVSVIIPTYNRWPMLREAVESVLAQTFTDYELIIVDDGSTDETLGRLARMETPVHIVHHSRCGVSAARNIGVRVARGRYLAFLDSDDMWLPRKLAVQIPFLDDHPEIGICQTEEVWIRGGVRVNAKVRHRKPSGDIFRRSLDLCLVSPSAVAIRRDLFVKYGGFDERLPVCEDYDLWLRISVENEVILLSQPLVIKRGGHGDQLSRSTWGLDRYRIVALQKLLRSGLAGRRREWVLKALERKVSVLAGGARKRGRDAEASAYEAIYSEFQEESSNDGRGDSRVRRSAAIPFPDPRTLVGMESGG